MSDYPDGLTVKPLTTWPGDLTRPHARQRSPFSAPLKATLSTLDRELFQLSARTPVMEVAIPENQWRIDGLPRATAKAEHPGVVLSLPHTSVGALRYATDRFLTWQDNLRAIALGLEALRRVERYGITRRGEQYAGFKALPPATPPGPMNRAEARAFIAKNAGLSTSVILDLDAAYREAAKKLHPDREGGDTELFQRLQEAMRIVRGES